MTVRPVFRRSRRGDTRTHIAADDLVLAGSCLLVSPTLALTCIQVCRGDPEWRDDEIAAEDIIVGSPHQRVTRIHGAASGADGLALLELAGPEAFTPAVFSRQWRLDQVYAHGFRRPPFDDAEREGPFALNHRAFAAGAPRRMPLSHGVPEGFSGGPLTGQFNGARYCLGLGCNGGSAGAAATFIPAAACAAFVAAHSDTTCTLVDLSRQVLSDFLGKSELLIEARNNHRLTGAVLVSSGPFDVTNAPLVHVRAINRTARPALARGERPDRIALAVTARELKTFLTGGAHDEPTETLCRFFEQSEPSLRFSEALAECVDAGVVVIAVIGHESVLRPGDATDPLSAFLIAMRRMLAANEARRRRA